MTVRQFVSMLVVAIAVGFTVGYFIGNRREQQRVQSRYEAAQAAYYESCQALSAAVDRRLEADRRHMLESHGMVFIEGKGWVRR